MSLPSATVVTAVIKTTALFLSVHNVTYRNMLALSFHALYLCTYTIQLTFRAGGKIGSCVGSRGVNELASNNTAGP